MSSWPPPPEVVAGGALTVCGWLIVRLWNRLVGRLEALEREAVRREDQKEREDRLERSIASLQAAVHEGFKHADTSREALRAEIQRTNEMQARRTSTLVREVHAKIERVQSELRQEIAAVRDQRTGAGD